MTTAFERIVTALEARQLMVKSTGQRKVSAQCPAHEDRAPSLSVTGIEGQALAHCHAGCAIGDVLAALDLGKADMYDTRRGADYKYDNGRVVHRRLDKSFPQSNTDKPPELYRLAKVRQAIADQRPVYVVEGEKDVLALESLGAVATCAPMGAGKFGRVDPSPLYGGQVFVVADQDEPGRKHAGDVVASLRGHAEVVVLAPRVGKDAADHVAAGYGLEDLVVDNNSVRDDVLPAVRDDVLPAVRDANRRSDSPDNDETPTKKSAATVLVELALARYTIHVSDDGEPFAVPVEGEPVARLLRDGRRGLRADLARLYFAEFGKAAPQQALADALLVIEGLANDAEPEPLPLRVAKQDGTWWLDLGDATGEAIAITSVTPRWSIGLPPMKFRRSVLTATLPRPATGGSLDELWSLLNVARPDRPLMLAWLIAALVADIPHPVLALVGEQGTGKSTAARILTSLVDPSPVPLRKAPRDADSWVTAASGSWIVGIDNVSSVPDWLSDTLCRAVTGEGDVRRRLYTDAGLALFTFRRVILLNGIDLGAVRGDLADRLLTVDLDVITEKDRRLDADLAARWDAAHPRVLGALLDLAASVASVIPSVRLETSPRMADFARLLAAVDQVLSTNGLDRYADRAKTLARESLSADPFVAAMLTQLEDEITCTSAELLTQITHGEDKAVPKGWPANARKLTTLLKRQAPVMRRAGWTVDELPAGHDNALRWRLARPEKACKQRSQGSQHSHDDSTASVASVASDEYAPSQDDETTLVPNDPGQNTFIASTTGDPLHSCPMCGRSTRPQRGHPSLCLDCTAAEIAAQREQAS